MDSKPEIAHLEKPEFTHLENGLAGERGASSIASFQRGSVEERALVRKIDLRLLPMLWVMYIFNYIDRTNIANAKVGGMAAQLKLTSSDYSLALSIFFVGYLLNEIPCNLVLARSRPSLFLPSTMLIWGCISVAAKGVKNLAGLVALRFFLGVVEAGFFPGIMLLLSCWYRPEELSKRMAMFYSASLVSGAFGSLLGGVITQYMKGLGNTPGWQWLFMIEGFTTIVISSVAYFVLPDYPTTTRWLSDDERTLAVARLTNAQDDTGVRLTHKQAFVAAVKDPKTWIFMMVYVFINGAGTISYFFPTLMTSLGYTARNAQFMTIPIYVVSLVISLAMGYSSDKTNQKHYHFIAACIVGAISFIVCAVVKKEAVRYAFICFGGAGIWSAVPIFLSYMITQFEGREKRAVSIAIINGFGNLASVYGSFIWPASTAPLYHAGFATTTALISAAAFLMGWIRYKYGNVVLS